MTFEEACDAINKMIEKSPSDGYAFERVKRCSHVEIMDFESKYKVKLHDDYRYFLLNVGIPNIYLDEFGLGIKFLPLDHISSFSSEVFRGMSDPFPKLLIIASNTGRGDFIGYGIVDNSQNYQLATFSHEEDPERWLQDTDRWSSLRNWLVALVSTEGERDTV